MDDFKKTTINEYGWELAISKEYGKHRVKREDKKMLRRLSRRRLNNKRNED